MENVEHVAYLEINEIIAKISDVPIEPRKAVKIPRTIVMIIKQQSEISRQNPKLQNDIC